MATRSPLAEDLRSWLEANLTGDVVDCARRGLGADTLDVLRDWNRRLADAGWAAVGWPVERGGRAASVADQVSCSQALRVAGAPGPLNDIGVANIAPAIMTFGTPAQQDRHLRPMLRGDEIWSQGMSEPDAGSDLASLRTSAVLEDDHFVVNGQKIWNSHGDLADWCQLYVRSDPGQTKHRGLSCLLVDMGAPGIDVRPIRTITGEAPFAEIWLHDVRVPATALLGPLHAGWNVAMATLGHERAGVAGLHVQLAATFERLVADVQAAGIARRPVVRQRLAELLASISCMRWTTERLLEETAGTAPAPTTGSLAKLSWAAIEQAMASAAVDLLGVGALDGPWAVNLSRARQASIAGGTTEINRTIVGEQALGLPRPR